MTPLLEKIRFENNINNNCFYLKREAYNDNQSFQMEMIVRNEIKGFIPLTEIDTESGQELMYKINGMQSLDKYFERNELDHAGFLSLFTKINTIITECETYLLDMQCIVLSPTFIYIDTNEQLFLTFYPYYIKDMKEQIGEFSQYLLGKIQKENKKVVQMAYQLYRQTREDNFTLNQIIEELSELCYGIKNEDEGANKIEQERKWEIEEEKEEESKQEKSTRGLAFALIKSGAMAFLITGIMLGVYFYFYVCM